MNSPDVGTAEPGTQASAEGGRPRAEGGPALSAEQAMALSLALDQGLVSYDLRPIEVLLLLILKRETYGLGRLAAPIRLEAWAGELGKRGDKLQPYFEELMELKIVDVNAGQGSYQLRPQLKFWSVARGRRVPEKQADGTLKLPLQSDRPLDDAYSAVATESVLRGTEVSGAGPFSQGKRPEDGPPSAVGLLRRTGGRRTEGGGRRTEGGGQRTEGGGRKTEDAPACQVDWQGLREWIDRGGEPPAKFAGSAADKSAGTRRINPPEGYAQAAAKFAAMEVAQGPPLAGAADKSAELFTIPLELASSSVQKLASYRAAEKSAEALEWVRKQDLEGNLRSAKVAAQWAEICDLYPNYVLGKLREDLAARRLKAGTLGAMRSTLGWMACRALDDGKMARLNGKARK